MKRPRESRARPDLGRSNRKEVADLQTIVGYEGKYAPLDDEHLDFYAAPGAPPLPHYRVLALIGEITRHRARRFGPLEDLPEPPPEDPEPVRRWHVAEPSLLAFEAYKDARAYLSARRKERALISRQKRSFLNNPPPRDRMARNDVFRYWTERPTAPVDPNTCAGDVAALWGYRGAANEVFDMLDAFDYESDTPVQVWIQREGDLAGPFCWTARPWDTGDFSDIRPCPGEDL